MGRRIHEAIAETRCALLSARISDTASIDAKLLVSKATGLDETALITHRDSFLSDAEEQNLASLLEQRLASIPMAYILGHREFYDLDFKVDSRVLIPRGDSETIVETVIRETKEKAGTTDFNILDLCTGSGCLGITLAHLFHCPVTLSDISPDALSVAGENAKRILDEQYTLMESDLFEKITDSFSVIVTNPPYLADDWIAEAEDQVKKEPMLALRGLGADGLSIIRNLVPQATHHLKSGGKLFIELDPRQSEEVRALLLANGFSSVYIEKDLAGRDRVVWGCWHV